jgi:anaerobic dimethyl sulfoxide reductase subunit B (iron-sulfur subunit)
MAKQLAFYFNANACTGCKACQTACKDKWDLNVGQTWRRVAEYSGGNWVVNADGTYTQNIFAYYTSVACNHCESPTCLEVCPSKAISKRDDGIVLIDDAACIGCRYCEWACPYAAPQFDEARGVMTKCNMCYDAVDAGGKPACVAACPSRALDFGELEELRAKYGDVAEIAPLPSAEYTQPALVITPHKHAAPVGSAAGELANPEEV